MKKIWGLGALLFTCGVGLTQFACSTGPSEEAESIGGERKMDDLIGSVPVNSKSLDGIGSIGLVYDYSYPGGSAGFGGLGETAGAPTVGGAPNAAGGAFSTVASAGFGCSGNCQATFYPQCTGTLVSKTSVLTSRSCAQLFEQTFYGYSSLE